MSLNKSILIGGTALVLFALIAFLIKPTPPHPIKLPEPNGYDDLVKAGRMLSGNLPDCYGNQMDEDCLNEVRIFLNANHEALKLVRLGLSRESRIPFEFTPSSFDKHFEELPIFKQLAVTMAAEGKVAEKENRRDDAIQSYLDAARIGEKMRGGVMIDALVVVAVETVGVNSLQNLSSAMTRDQRQNVIQTLLELDSTRESLDEISANEKAFVQSASSPQDRIAGLIRFRAMQRTQKSFETKIKSRREQTASFIIDLATKNYELDKQISPKTIQELIPEYLPLLPNDSSRKVAR